MKRTKDDIEHKIFKRGSTTYYWSSRFFPEPIRRDVFKLYSFVRIADNYVDEQPAQPEKLLALEEAWQAALRHPERPLPMRTIDERVIQNIVTVTRQYHIDPTLVDAFFTAMKADMYPEPYATLEDSLAYVYGSAEVVGVMMAKVMGLPDAALPAAMMQGRAMQWINFIRDIAEDQQMGRNYFPQTDMQAYNLPDLTKATAQAHRADFTRFMHVQLDRYHTWQRQAAEGYHYIPRRYRTPLQTAAGMYTWTAKQITANPHIVYERKVKPSKWRVMSRAANHLIQG